MNLPLFLAIGGFALGLIGTVLSIVNFIRAVVSSRVRLRVRCYPLAILNPGNTIKECACVEVVNLGSFPVTLKEIAFEPCAGLPHGGKMTMRNDGCLNGKYLPVRIEPHDSVQVFYSNLESATTMIKQCRRAIVETACGKIHFGELKTFQEIVKRCEQNAART
jgi:hypothetical protein